MTATNAFDTQRQTPAGALLGRQWLGAEGDTGRYRLRFEARPEFMNRHGTVQGGFLCAMLDSAAGMTLGTALTPDQTAVTVQLNTTFIKPAAAGTLFVSAWVESIDERDAVINAELQDAQGQVLTRASATMRILKRNRT